VETPNPTVNPSSIVDILTLRYDTSIQPNLPKKTWEDFIPIDKPPSIPSIENSICNEIESNLESHSSKDISIALSGGVDSTLVLSLLRKTNPDLKINAVSIKFANSVDETPAAAKIAERFEAEHNVIQLENYLSELPKAISIIKLPFWDLHWYYVVKKSKTLSKTIISGDGGDELFAGYTFRYKKFLSLTSENSTPLEKVKAYLQCHERDRVSDQENIFNQKCRFTSSKIVTGSYTGKQFINHTNSCRFSWNITANLCQDCNKPNLPQICALSCHIRASNNGNLNVFIIQFKVIWNKILSHWQKIFNHRMATVFYSKTG